MIWYMPITGVSSHRTLAHKILTNQSTKLSNTNSLKHQQYTACLRQQLPLLLALDTATYQRSCANRLQINVQYVGYWAKDRRCRLHQNPGGRGSSSNSRARSGKQSSISRKATTAAAATSRLDDPSQSNFFLKERQKYGQRYPSA